MKILVLNGSPKGERSNTLKLTKAFCEGIAEAERLQAGQVQPERVESEGTQLEGTQTEIINICQKKILDCLGCFRCWSDTPGVCCLKDDMAEIISRILEADVIIWSFPLYYFSLPSRCKALMDRLLPMNLPFMSQGTETGGHPSRYDLTGKRYAVISTCGFYTSEGNYNAVNAQFNRLYGKDGYTAIYCGEGELFRVDALRKRTGEYLDWVRRAGREYAAGAIAPATRELLAQLLVPREAFEEMADADWGVRKEQPDSQGQPAPYIQFTRQMAAFYNKKAWGGKDRVVEFYYTDVDGTCQILLQKDGHRVLTKDFLPYTTRIETPLSVWREIGDGKRSGHQAMMEHLYTVQGDFDLMLRWGEFFGFGGSDEPAHESGKKTNMALLLVPWITIWALLDIHPVWGGAAGILVSAALPLAFLKWKPTVFDGITSMAVAGIGLLALLGCSVELLLPVSYLLFGIMWMATVFLRLPLSAWYSINSYRGEREWENPLFLRTNRILTACWGALYLTMPLWTYFLLRTPYASLTGAANSVLPALMGGFTVWFQRWYPAYYASGGAARKRKNPKTEKP